MILNHSKLICLLILMTAFSGCHKAVDVDEQGYTTDFKQAKKWLVGEWKLTNVYTMMSGSGETKDYNVKLLITAEQITIIDNGKQIDRVDFELIKESYGFLLKTNAQPRPDNWYVRNPAVKVSRSALFLDTGMAFDAPGFRFQRIR